VGLFDKDDPEGVFPQLSELEARIGLPLGFCEGLREEPTDWSFVIKLHALFEAAITQLLVGKLARPELSELVSQMDMGHPRTGKIQMAKALGVLEEEERRFVRYLSMLRNDLVHNVGNVTFTFDDYPKSLDTNKRRELVQAVAWAKDAPPEVAEYLLKTLRTQFWVMGVYTLSLMNMRTVTAAYEQERDRLAVESAQLEQKLVQVLAHAAMEAKADVKMDAHLQRPEDKPS
jgi:hypothetical protein